MKKGLIKNYSWTIRGSQRIKIIKILKKQKTPKQITIETKLKFSNVSDCLRALTQKKLIKCLNPKDHLGRLYELTPKGKQIQKELN